MQLKIDVKSIREVLNLLNVLIYEAKVDFTPDGLSIRVMDTARISMMKVEVKKDAFQEYNVETETSVGLDIGPLKNFLKIVSQENVMEISIDNENISVKVGNLSAKFKLIDPDAITVPRIPAMTHSNGFVIDKSTLLKGIKAAETISNVVKFSNNSAGVKISAKGESELETIDMEIPKESVKDLVYASDVKSSFLLEYLLKFVQVVESAVDLRVQLSNDYPIQIGGKFLNGKGDVTFLLAPRID